MDVQHVLREHNTRADVLSKLASTKKKGGNKSVILEILPRPSTHKPLSTLEVFSIWDSDCWMTPVHNYLTKGKLPADSKEAAAVRRRACSYFLVEGKLSRRGFSTPLLKCVDQCSTNGILLKIHEGISDQHLGGRSLTRNAL